MKTGFITCNSLSKYRASNFNRLITHDDELAFKALEDAGHCVEAVVWNTPVSELVEKGFEVLIMRSPWDYMSSSENYKNFLKWIDEIENSQIKLLNSASLMKWNLDKKYLQNFNDEEIDIVPTFFLLSNDELDLIEYFKKNGKIVVKPCVSAGANDTFRLLEIKDVHDFVHGTGKYGISFDDLRKNRDFMIQPYIEEIVTSGEWSLIYFRNEYSHSVLKVPATGNWLVQDDFGGSVQSGKPPDKIRKLADKVWHNLKYIYNKYKNQENDELEDFPLYGRVDIVTYKDQPYLTELELVEPELFFKERNYSVESKNELAVSGFLNAFEELTKENGDYEI